MDMSVQLHVAAYSLEEGTRASELFVTLGHDCGKVLEVRANGFYDHIHRRLLSVARLGVRIDCSKYVQTTNYYYYLPRRIFIYLLRRINSNIIILVLLSFLSSRAPPSINTVLIIVGR